MQCARRQMNVPGERLDALGGLAEVRLDDGQRILIADSSYVLDGCGRQDQLTSL